MSLQTPSVREIRDSIVAQLQTELNQTIPLLPKSFVRVLATVLAGVFILLYKYCGWILQQMFVSTASAVASDINGVEIVPLRELGNLVGAGDPVPATRAILVVSFPVTAPGEVLPAGTQLVSATNGVTYLTVVTITLAGSVSGTGVIASYDQSGGNGAGAIGNLDPGETLSFVNPLAAVGRTATVISTSVSGADGETEEAYRQRIRDRFQKRPQGGAYADYLTWGSAVAGVANIYPYTSSDPGEVDVYVEASDLADGIPNSALLQAVADAIEADESGLATRRPVGASINTLAITRTSFTVVVSGLSVDNSGVVSADIVAAVEQYFLDREPYIAGLSVLPRKDRITDSGVTSVVEQIVNAAGGVFTGVVLAEGGTPFTQRVLEVGEKAKASSVTVS